MCGDEVAAALILSASDVSTPPTTSLNIPCFQVTTHSHLLSQDELDRISSTLSLDPYHIHVFSLQEFDTELDFSNKVRYVLSTHHCRAVYYVPWIHHQDSTMRVAPLFNSTFIVPQSKFYLVFICTSQYRCHREGASGMRLQ